MITENVDNIKLIIVDEKMLIIKDSNHFIPLLSLPWK